MKTTTASALGIATLLLVAACGSSSGSSPGAQSSAASSGVKLTSQPLPQVGNVLVDASGRTVYAADQESSGQIVCTDSCTSIWVPVTVPAGSKPVAGPGVTAHLSTIQRSDGESQVTAAGDPLYIFNLDPSPGAANGNGVADSFNGASFTWHAVAPGGSSAQSTSTPSPSPSDSSSGGYRY
ncbi:MAG TPA: hypothetical protein VMT88_02205 [Actinomycetes bacterium]|nr:hypothetical protein [Actinomycetes bacterium]